MASDKAAIARNVEVALLIRGTTWQTDMSLPHSEKVPPPSQWTVHESDWGKGRSITLQSPTIRVVITDDRVNVQAIR
jgi:hypothetical protein